MKYKALDVNGEVVVVQDSDWLVIAVDGVRDGIEIDEKTFKEIKKNHKDFEFDREKRTIKRKEPKKEKE